MVYTTQEFANIIRQKAPGAYDSWDDEKLTTSFVKKYPQYKEQVELPKQPSKVVGLTKKALGVPEKQGIGEFYKEQYKGFLDPSTPTKAYQSTRVPMPSIGGDSAEERYKRPDVSLEATKGESDLQTVTRLASHPTGFAGNVAKGAATIPSWIGGITTGLATDPLYTAKTGMDAVGQLTNQFLDFTSDLIVGGKKAAEGDDLFLKAVLNEAADQLYEYPLETIGMGKGALTTLKKTVSAGKAGYYITKNPKRPVYDSNGNFIKDISARDIAKDWLKWQFEQQVPSWMKKAKAEPKTPPPQTAAPGTKKLQTIAERRQAEGTPFTPPPKTPQAKTTDTPKYTTETKGKKLTKLQEIANERAKGMVSSIWKQPVMREKYISKVGQPPEVTLLEDGITGSLESQQKQVLDKANASIKKARELAKQNPDEFLSEEGAWITNKIIETVDMDIPGVAEVVKPIKEMNKRFKQGNATAEDMVLAKTFISRYEQIYDAFGRVKKTGDVFEKEAIAKMYDKLKTDLEISFENHGIDFKKVNHDTMKYQGLRDLMTRAISREANRDAISLSDYVLGGVGIGVDPIGGLTALLVKKTLSSPNISSKIASSLYTKQGDVYNTSIRGTSTDNLRSKGQGPTVNKYKKEQEAARKAKEKAELEAKKKRKGLPATPPPEVAPGGLPKTQPVPPVSTSKSKGIVETGLDKAKRPGTTKPQDKAPPVSEKTTEKEIVEKQPTKNEKFYNELETKPITDVSKFRKGMQTPDGEIIQVGFNGPRAFFRVKGDKPYSYRYSGEAKALPKPKVDEKTNLKTMVEQGQRRSLYTKQALDDLGVTSLEDLDAPQIQELAQLIRARNFDDKWYARWEKLKADVTKEIKSPKKKEISGTEPVQLNKVSSVTQNKQEGLFADVEKPKTKPLPKPKQEKVQLEERKPVESMNKEQTIKKIDNILSQYPRYGNSNSYVIQKKVIKEIGENNLKPLFDSLGINSTEGFDKYLKSRNAVIRPGLNKQKRKELEEAKDKIFDEVMTEKVKLAKTESDKGLKEYDDAIKEYEKITGKKFDTTGPESPQQALEKVKKETKGLEEKGEDKTKGLTKTKSEGLFTKEDVKNEKVELKPKDSKGDMNKRSELSNVLTVKNVDGEKVVSTYFDDVYAIELDKEILRKTKGEKVLTSNMIGKNLEEVVLPDTRVEEYRDALIPIKGSKKVDGAGIRRYAPLAAKKLDELYSEQTKLTSDNFKVNEKVLDRILDEALREAEIRRENAGYIPTKDKKTPLAEKEPVKLQENNVTKDTQKKVEKVGLDFGGKELTLKEKVQLELDKKQSEKEYKDVGTRVAGSRKEKAQYKKLTAKDLEKAEKQGEVFAQDIVTKDRVIEKYNPQEARKSGENSGVVFMKDTLLKKIQNKPENTAQARKAYVHIVPAIAKYIEEAKSLDDLSILGRLLTKEFMGMHGGKFKSVTLFSDEFVKEFPFLDSLEVESVFGKQFTNQIKKYGTEATQKKWREAEMLNQFTEEMQSKAYNEWKEKTEKRVKENYEKEMGMTDEQRQAEAKKIYGKEKYWIILKKNRLSNAEKNLDVSLERFLQQYPSKKARKDSREWLEKSKPVGLKSDTGKPRIHEGEKLKEIKRKGGRDVLDEEVKDPKTLEDLFGYKSVQFGNYVKDIEAQKHIKSFIGSMKDLEDVLGIDLKKINKEAGLSMAFGARGGGKASAHYESSYKIINVTKTRGDGSVAHEWGHFLDDFIGEKTFGKKEKNGHRLSYVTPKGNTDIHNAARKVMKAIKGGDGESTERMYFKPNNSTSYYKTIREKYKEGGKDVALKYILDSTSKYNKTEYGEKSIKKYLQALTNEIGKSTSYDVPTWKTRYFADATTLGDYRKRDHELFARAWETYIADKLLINGMESNYLVGDNKTNKTTNRNGREYNVYPIGKERAKINEAFDELLNTIKKEYPELFRDKMGNQKKIGLSNK